KGHCDWTIRVSRDGRVLSGAAASALNAVADVERFAVQTDASANTTLFAETERAALYALRSTLDLTVRGERVQVPAATLVDYPDMPVRGITEGFYGPPYTTDERLSVIARMDVLRQNRFLYAPQNDDYAHDRWAESYPDDESRSLQLAVSAADSNLIDFVWGF